MDKLSERIRRQVVATRGYLVESNITPHFADILMSHYLDFAREIEALDAARSEGLPPPGGGGGDKGFTESQTSPVGHGALPMPPDGEEFLEFKEALDDVRRLRAEYEDLNGGGPGWGLRNAAAWKRVAALFADEDEAAWHRQQEDAHG